jgi:hypothetical protein
LFDASGRIQRIGGIANNITERKQTEKVLKESEGYLRSTLDGLSAHIAVLDEHGEIILANKAYRDFGERNGVDPCDVSEGANYLAVCDTASGGHSEEAQPFADGIREVLSGKLPHFEIEYPCHSPDEKRWFVGRVTSSAGDGPRRAIVAHENITERKQAETYREMGREILQILNEPGDLQESIQQVLVALKTRTGVDAVGLRLQEGEDFPYFAQDGFSRDFLLTENTLIERSKDGGVCRDEDGNVKLECTCGLVISGKTDPSNPLFTQGGSCWTNDSFPLLDLPSDQDPRLHPRNNCIHQGYASVALIPIRTSDRIVGLIQLNDKRKGHFTL